MIHWIQAGISDSGHDCRHKRDNSFMKVAVADDRKKPVPYDTMVRGNDKPGSDSLSFFFREGKVCCQAWFSCSPDSESGPANPANA